MLLFLYAGTVKCHNVCKRHAAIGTGFKQTECTIFLHIISMELNCNCFQVNFVRNFVKTVSKFWKSYLTRTNILVPSVILVLLHHNTVVNVDQICCSNAVYFTLVTHTEVIGSPAQSSNSCSGSGWFVWNQLCVGVEA